MSVYVDARVASLSFYTYRNSSVREALYSLATYTIYTWLKMVDMAYLML